MNVIYPSFKHCITKTGDRFFQLIYILRVEKIQAALIKTVEAHPI